MHLLLLNLLEALKQLQNTRCDLLLGQTSSSGVLGPLEEAGARSKSGGGKGDPLTDYVADGQTQERHGLQAQ